MEKTRELERARIERRYEMEHKERNVQRARERQESVPLADESSDFPEELIREQLEIEAELKRRRENELRIERENAELERRLLSEQGGTLNDLNISSDAYARTNEPYERGEPLVTETIFLPDRQQTPNAVPPDTATGKSPTPRGRTPKPPPTPDAKRADTKQTAVISTSPQPPADDVQPAKFSVQITVQEARQLLSEKERELKEILELTQRLTAQQFDEAPAPSTSTAQPQQQPVQQPITVQTSAASLHHDRPDAFAASLVSPPMLPPRSQPQFSPQAYQQPAPPAHILPPNGYYPEQQQFFHQRRPSLAFEQPLAYEQYMPPAPAPLPRQAFGSQHRLNEMPLGYQTLQSTLSQRYMSHEDLGGYAPPASSNMARGFEMFKLLRDAERRGFSADDVEIAFAYNSNKPLGECQSM